MWQLPCGSGHFEHATTWNPADTRYTSDSPAGNRAPADIAMCALRPLSRGDAETGRRGDGERFDSVAFRRNNAESFNHGFESSLPHHGRAATLSPVQQELDFLSFAALNNAITWSRRSL